MWDACLTTAAELLNDKADGLAPACRKSYKELCVAVQSAQSLMQQTGETATEARDRVLRLYKPSRSLPKPSRISYMRLKMTDSREMT